jgi:hypothetical protein
MTLREIGGELISAFADAVLAFIRDPEAVQQFHREQRRWITWQMPEPRSDGKILSLRLSLSRGMIMVGQGRPCFVDLQRDGRLTRRPGVRFSWGP